MTGRLGLRTGPDAALPWQQPPMAAGEYEGCDDLKD